MDLSADSGTVPTHTIVGGSMTEQELSLSTTHCQTESGGNILLQLLEFKTHLLECVEELHIRRDAETRFEEQISKLVLEKQELEWEKESFQDQIETKANQHMESLISAKKQFQAKMRNIEEEKGKYQVSAELKDKENNNLKEELKSLQLLKYNLEKKSSELEQKLALQSRSKDSHLNQLGEVEKRFSALSRHCATVKQAHEKLAQDVDEAIKINRKLTLANENQEATIVSLKKELELVSNKLVKTKMSSMRHDRTHSPAGREQLIQQLQHKLNMETEMNKRLREENEGVQVGKQEVMKYLQNTQQMLLSQTQTVNRLEMELQKQREQYEALKQEHEVMREKSKATEDKVAQLMESYTASKTSWDKEKTTLLDQIKSEQQNLQEVKEAYDNLHHKHSELSSQAKVHTKHIHDLKMRHNSHSTSVSHQLSSASVNEIRGEKTLLEPFSGSKPHGVDRPLHMASTQTKNLGSLEGTIPDANTAIGGQCTPNQLQQSKDPLASFVSSLNNELFSPCNVCGTSDSVSSMIDKHPTNFNKSGPDSCVSDKSAVSSLRQRLTTGTVDSLNRDVGDKGSGRIFEKEKEWDDNIKQCGGNREEKERDKVQQWKTEVQGEDVKEEGISAEKKDTLIVQTTDRADRQEDSQWSTDDARDTKQPETETRDIAEEEGIYGAERSGKTGLDMPETQIPAQTNTDMTTEMSGAQQVIDFMRTESPSVACKSLDCSQSLSEMVSEKDVDSKEKERMKEINFYPDGHQSVSPNFDIHKGEVYSVAQDSSPQLTNPVHQIIEETPEKKPYNQSATDTSTEHSEPVSESSICQSKINAPMVVSQSDGNVSIQELEETTTQKQPHTPSDNNEDMKQTDEFCSTHVGQEFSSVRAMVKPQPAPQIQQMPEQQSGQTKSLLTDDVDDYSTVCERMKVQSHVCDAQKSVEKSNLKEVCVDNMVNSVDTESKMRTGSCQQIADTMGAKTNKHESDLMLSVLLSHENNASPETVSREPVDGPPAKQINTKEASLPSNYTHRSFDWSSAQRKAGLSRSAQTTSGLSGRIPSTRISMQNQGPLVITRASDLLNASSVCGTTASSSRLHQGETCGETVTADTESRTSLSISSFPISTSSIIASRLSWKTASGCSRAPASAAGPSSEPDLEPFCSQEREDQQSSFRAQISKIEQFLNMERLRLPKRRRTEN